MPVTLTPLATLTAALPKVDSVGIVVRLLPDTITLAVVPAAAAVGGALFALVGIARHASRERIGRLVLAGNLTGAATGLVAFVAAVVVSGFS